MKQLFKKSLEKSISYTDYRKLVSNLLEKGKSTGTMQSEDLLNYSKLNVARMHRLDLKTILTDETISALKAVNRPQTWLVITEGWCGDAAQILPVLNTMSLVNEHIDFRIVLRDENPELMSQFLTNGSMSIPILLLLNDAYELMGSWGPRPSIATQMVQDYKATHGGLDAEFKKELQVWYNKDKGQSIQKDLIGLID
jgi:hypothetical protein|uniref:thioredoxin family protein n=1 Tax=Polaribacter sp. TaxID=1920175 RepID=UPI004047CB21